MKTRAAKRVKVLRGPEWHAGWKAGRTELRSDEWAKAYNEGFTAGTLKGLELEQQATKLVREELLRLQEKAQAQIESSRRDMSKRHEEGRLLGIRAVFAELESLRVRCGA